MAAENLDQGEARRFPGFRSLADEDDRFVDDWDGGDEQSDAPLDEAPGTVGRRAGQAGLLVGGLLCAALAAGAAITWPDLSARWARRDVPPPPAQTRSLSVQLAQGDVGQPEPPPPAQPLRPANSIPAPTGAASPDRFAPAAPGVVVRPAGTAAPVVTVQPGAEPPPVLPRTELRSAEQAPALPLRPDREAAPASRAPAAVRVPGALDCGNARSLAQDLVCHDPGLRAAEGRMSRAYAAALAAGAPERQLRGDQVDWLNMREDAARYSKQAVENMYRQRIQELEALGDEPPP
jgi:hypothetical protein